jgi:argininosuccinate lyase
MNNEQNETATAASSEKLWGGRFSGTTDHLVERLNNSLSFDSRMWREDIQGSIAHATMLGETAIISAEDSRAIAEGLAAIGSELSAGTLVLNSTAEDIHSAIESMLKDRIGPAAGRLHTARSRNDQVATDTRLYLRGAISEIDTLLRSFQSTLIRLAEREMETILPGYTHLQHAQPVLLSHHLLAYFWMLQRDRDRLSDCQKRVNIMPLGAGALAGTPFPIDRERVAELLGFDGVAENSLDAVSDRDFAIEFLAASSILMVHLSRLAEEIILWNSPEFGFVELDDSVTTGSSIMPQKKNPDVAELARGKTGRVFGDLMALLTVMKGLPLAYNKDMQEDKEALFDTVDTLLTLLPPFEKTVATARFDRIRMESALHGDFSTATDLADQLVRQGRTFRDAHHIVGEIVRDCIDRGVGLEALDEMTLQKYAPELARAGTDASVQSSVRSRRARGGTSPEAVLQQLERAKSLL